MNKTAISDGWKRYGWRAVRQIVIILACVCMLVPFAVSFMVSIKTGADVYSISFLPKKVYFQNYWYVLKETQIIPAFVNTIAYLIPPIGVGVITSSMAAYALSRLRFRGRDMIFLILFATIMVPSTVTLVPSYVMFANFYDWVGTPLPMIIPGMFGGVLVMFYLRQFMLGLPKELEEAAMIDGMTKGGIFFRIDLPLCRPAIIAQIVLSFTAYYNDLMTPLMYVNTQPQYYTVQLVINTLNSAYGSQLERLLAACILALIPTLVIFAAAQKYFIEGIAVTGIKG